MGNEEQRRARTSTFDREVYAWGLAVIAVLVALTLIIVLAGGSDPDPDGAVASRPGAQTQPGPQPVCDQSEYSTEPCDELSNNDVAALDSALTEDRANPGRSRSGRQTRSDLGARLHSR